MRRIDLTDHTYKRLLLRAESFDDDAEAVILRLLNGDEAESTDESAHHGSPARESRPILPEGEYWTPILAFLVEHGGSAPSSEVVAAIGDQLKDRLTEADLDRVQSGEPRWQNRARFARLRMKELGLLSDKSPRGIWEVTDPGREYLQKENPQ